MTDLEVIHAAWPSRGPCAFCCGGDARHRIWDTIVGRWLGGDSIDVLAHDYDVARDAIEPLLRLSLRAKPAKKRPGGGP